MKTLLPNPAVLSLEKIISQADAITMIVTANSIQPAESSQKTCS
jgi:hypothetical protein